MPTSARQRPGQASRNAPAPRAPPCCRFPPPSPPRCTLPGVVGWRGGVLELEAPCGLPCAILVPKPFPIPALQQNFLNVKPSRLAELEDVLLAVDDLEAAGGGEHADVAGVEPALAVDGLGAGQGGPESSKLGGRVKAAAALLRQVAKTAMPPWSRAAVETRGQQGTNPNPAPPPSCPASCSSRQTCRARAAAPRQRGAPGPSRHSPSLTGG